MLYKSLFYFDIETAGKYPTLDEYKKNDERGYDLFIRKCYRRRNDNGWSDMPDQVYLNKCALYPEFAQVVCLSYGYFNSKDQVIIKSIIGTEQEIITESHDLFCKVGSSTNPVRPLCGFNIKHFDIPFLIRKFFKYGFKVPEILSTYNKKPWEMSVVDISEIWKANNFEHVSFDEVTYDLGVPSPKEHLCGEDVHDTFWKDGDIESIRKYCENDVDKLIEVAKLVIEKY